MPKAIFLKQNIIGTDDGYLIRYLVQQEILKKAPVPCPRMKYSQNYYPLSMQDMIKAVIHALTTNEAEGGKFSLLGKQKYTYIEILNILSNWMHSSVPKQKSLCCISTFLAEAIVGWPHDKNMMQMIYNFEKDPVNFTDNPNYLEVAKIPSTFNFAENYKAGTFDPNQQKNYLKPYLYRYKSIILD